MLIVQPIVSSITEIHFGGTEENHGNVGEGGHSQGEDVNPRSVLNESANHQRRR